MDPNAKRAEEIAKDFVNDLKNHISINKAVLFGSYAKGTFS
jgi:predicted nucleotidyltransferase